MTWLTWRQFRVQAVTAAVALAAFAVVLGVTQQHVASLYRSLGVAGCTTTCDHAGASFLTDLSGAYTVVFIIGIAAVVLAPVVIGMFWGAPLVARELETGTFRLAWTQTITRARWLASKLALPGLTAIAVTEGLSLLFGWWAAPIGQAARVTGDSSFPLGMGPYSLLAFDAHGVVPLGYAAFAFTLGVTTGTFIRRTVPAMAVTLAVFAVVQVAMPLAVRPHLFPPVRQNISIATEFSGQESVNGDRFTLALDFIPSKPGAWIMSSQAVNAAGQPVSVMPPVCRALGSGDPMQCLVNHGIQVAVSYQPASRYWAFQRAETGIFLALALALAGFCCWRLTRRLS